MQTLYPNGAPDDTEGYRRSDQLRDQMKMARRDLDRMATDYNYAKEQIECVERNFNISFELGGYTNGPEITNKILGNVRAFNEATKDSMPKFSPFGIVDSYAQAYPEDATPKKLEQLNAYIATATDSKLSELDAWESWLNDMGMNSRKTQGQIERTRDMLKHQKKMCEYVGLRFNGDFDAVLKDPIVNILTHMTPRSPNDETGASPLTDIEKRTYAYLYKTKGEDAAWEFYLTLDDPTWGFLETRRGQAFSEWADTFTKEMSQSALGIAGTSVADVLLTPLNAMGSFYTLGTQGLAMVDNAIYGYSKHYVNPYSPEFNTQILTSYIKQYDRGAIVDWADKTSKGNEAIKFLAGAAYDAAVSGGESAVTGLIGGALSQSVLGEKSLDTLLGKFLGAVPMGLPSYGAGYREGWMQSGGDEGKATAKGILSFAAETLTETIEVGDVMDAYNHGSLTEFLNNKKWWQALQVDDTVGEGLSEAITAIGDDWIMGKASDARQNIDALMAAGYSPEEARTKVENDFWETVLTAAFIGGLSANMSAATGAAFGKVSQNMQRTRSINSLTQRLIDLGMNPDVARRIAEFAVDNKLQDVQGPPENAQNRATQEDVQESEAETETEPEQQPFQVMSAEDVRRIKEQQQQQETLEQIANEYANNGTAGERKAKTLFQRLLGMEKQGPVQQMQSQLAADRLLPGGLEGSGKRSSAAVQLNSLYRNAAKAGISSDVLGNALIQASLGNGLANEILAEISANNDFSAENVQLLVDAAQEDMANESVQETIRTETRNAMIETAVETEINSGEVAAQIDSMQAEVDARMEEARNKKGSKDLRAEIMREAEAFASDMQQSIADFIHETRLQIIERISPQIDAALEETNPSTDTATTPQNENLSAHPLSLANAADDMKNAILALGRQTAKSLKSTVKSVVESVLSAHVDSTDVQGQALVDAASTDIAQDLHKPGGIYDLYVAAARNGVPLAVLNNALVTAYTGNGRAQVVLDNIIKTGAHDISNATIQDLLQATAEDMADPQIQAIQEQVAIDTLAKNAMLESLPGIMEETESVRQADEQAQQKVEDLQEQVSDLEARAEEATKNLESTNEAFLADPMDSVRQGDVQHSVAEVEKLQTKLQDKQAELETAQAEQAETAKRRESAEQAAVENSRAQAMKQAQQAIAEDKQNKQSAREENARANVVEGNKGTVTTEPGGDPITFHWALVEDDGLIASNDTVGNVNEAYPQELQPRDRTREASQEQIHSMAKKLSPADLGNSAQVQQGAPTVGPDYVVESGNGRVSAIRFARQQGYESAQNYYNWLKENAASFGLDPESVTPNSVLVRVRESEVDRQKFVKDSNVSNTASYSDSEYAKSDAEKLLATDLMNLFELDQSGKINSRANHDFVTRFMSEIIPDNERGAYVQSDGTLNQAGISRIANAIFMAAYNNTNLMNAYAESTDENVKTMFNAMMAIAPKVVTIKKGIQNGEFYDIDISQDLAQAAESYRNLRRQGIPLNEYLQQIKIDPSMEESDTAKLFMELFDENKRSGKKTTAALNDIVETIISYGNPNQISFFSDSVVPDKYTLVSEAMNRTEQAQQREEATGTEDTKLSADTIENAADTIAEQTAERLGITDEDQIAQLKQRVRERYQERLEKAKAQYDTQREMLRERNKRIINTVADRFGYKVEFVDMDNQIEGMTNPDSDSKTIYIDSSLSESEQLKRVLFHELTHNIESTEEYQAIQDAIITQRYGTTYQDALDRRARGIMTAMDNELLADITAKQEAYKGKQKLSPEDAIKEITADLTGNLLYGDENAINSLCQTKPSIGQRILNFIKSIIDKLRGTNVNLSTLENTRNLFEQALAKTNPVDLTQTGATIIIPADIGTQAGKNGYFYSENPSDMHSEFKFSMPSERNTDDLIDRLIDQDLRRRSSERTTREQADDSVAMRAALDMISLGNPKPTGSESLAQRYNHFEQAVFDRTAALKGVSNEIRRTYGNLYSPTIDPRTMALQRESYTHNMTEMCLYDTLVDYHGNVVSKQDGTPYGPYEQFTRQVGRENEAEFNAFLLANYAVEREQHRKPLWEEYPENYDPREVIRETLERHNDWDKIRKDMAEWNTAFMQHHLVDTGILSQAALDKMRADYPSYIPIQLAQVPTDPLNPNPQGRPFTQQHLQFAGTNESGQLFNPLLAWVGQIESYIYQSANFQTMQALGRAFDEFGYLMGAEHIETTNGPTVSQDEDGQALINDPIGILDANSSFQYFTKDNTHGYDIVNIPQSDGTVKKYRVDDYHIIKAIAPAMPLHMGPLAKAVRNLTAFMQRMNTAMSIPFTGQNFMSDGQTAMITGNTGGNYFSYHFGRVLSLLDLIAQKGKESKGQDTSETYRLFKMFGEMGSRYSLHDNKTQKEIRNELYGREKLRDTWKRNKVETIADLAKLIVGKPFEKISELSDLLEDASRYNEFKSHQENLDTYEGRIEAGKAAREVTVDFSKSGTLADTDLKYLRAVIPFLGAQLQGVNKTLGYFTDTTNPNRGRYFRRMAFNTLLGATLMTVLRGMTWEPEEKDAYDEMSAYEKIRYAHVKLPGVGIVRVKRSQDGMIGFCNALGELLPNIVTGYDDSDWSQFVNMVGEVAINMLPTTQTVFQPVIDAMNNRNYYGGELAGDEFSNIAPRDRYKPETLGIFRTMGKLSGFPPVAWQYLAEQYTGSGGKFLMSSLSNMMDNEGNPLSDVWDAMYDEVLGKYSYNVVTSSRASSGLYTYYNQLNGIIDSDKMGIRSSFLSSGLSDAEYKRALKEAQRMLDTHGFVNTARADLRKMWNEYNKISNNPRYSKQEKEQMLYQKRVKINRKAMETNQKIARYFDKYGPFDPAKEVANFVLGNLNELFDGIVK